MYNIVAVVVGLACRVSKNYVANESTDFEIVFNGLI